MGLVVEPLRMTKVMGGFLGQSGKTDLTGAAVDGTREVAVHNKTGLVDIHVVSRFDLVIAQYRGLSSESTGKYTYKLCAQFCCGAVALRYTRGAEGLVSF